MDVKLKMIPNLPIYTAKVRMYANSLVYTSFTTTAFAGVAINQFYHGHINGGIAFTIMAAFDGAGVYVCQKELRAELQKINDFYAEILDLIETEHSRIKPGSFEDILLRITEDIPDTKPRE